MFSCAVEMHSFCNLITLSEHKVVTAARWPHNLNWMLPRDPTDWRVNEEDPTLYQTWWLDYTVRPCRRLNHSSGHATLEIKLNRCMCITKSTAIVNELKRTNTFINFIYDQNDNLCSQILLLDMFNVNLRPDICCYIINTLSEWRVMWRVQYKCYPLLESRLKRKISRQHITCVSEEVQHVL